MSTDTYAPGPSERLRYEDLRPDHLEKIFGLHRDPEVMRYIRGPESRDAAQASIGRCLTMALETPGLGIFPTYRKDNDEFIGWGLIKFMPGMPDHTIEIGYRLHQAAWRKGYATELCDHFLNHLFARGHRRVTAVTNPENLASQRVLEKCGFVRNGNLVYYEEDSFFYERIRGLRFVDYRPELRDAFIRLNREWLERHFTVEPTDAAVLADPEGRILADGGKIIFAEFEGEIVGTCSLIATGPGEFELAKMAVTESAQGKGIGSLMIAATISAARKAGAHEIHLLSNSKLGPALHLYRKHGFQDVPVTAADLAAYRRVDVRMVRKITV
jgi:putative acetyltransferase